MTEKERTRDLAYWFLGRVSQRLGDGNELHGWPSAINDGEPPPFMLSKADWRYVKKKGGFTNGVWSYISRG